MVADSGTLSTSKGEVPAAKALWRRLARVRGTLGRHKCNKCIRIDYICGVLMAKRSIKPQFRFFYGLKRQLFEAAHHNFLPVPFVGLPAVGDGEGVELVEEGVWLVEAQIVDQG